MDEYAIDVCHVLDRTFFTGAMRPAATGEENHRAAILRSVSSVDTHEINGGITVACAGRHIGPRARRVERELAVGVAVHPIRRGICRTWGSKVRRLLDARVSPRSRIGSTGRS